jgi:DNA-directed RNA polymerase I subunit RPA49
VDMMKHVPVRQWQEAVKQKKEVRVKSQFVANRIQGVAMSIEKMKILRYMLLLLEVYMNSRQARAGRILPKREEVKSFLGDMPEAVLESVKRKFSDAGIMSKFKSDLMITHLCAMACLVDSYQVDMWDLKEDLNMEIKDMSRYFHEIGAKVGTLPEGERRRLNLDKAQASQHKVAKLKLPLDFPKVAFARKAR